LWLSISNTKVTFLQESFIDSSSYLGYFSQLASSYVTRYFFPRKPLHIGSLHINMIYVYYINRWSWRNTCTNKDTYITIYIYFNGQALNKKIKCNIMLDAIVGHCPTQKLFLLYSKCDEHSHYLSCTTI
jgi:hypothetical protein